MSVPHPEEPAERPPSTGAPENPRTFGQWGVPPQTNPSFTPPTQQERKAGRILGWLVAVFALIVVVAFVLFAM